MAAPCLIKRQGTHESRPRRLPSSLLYMYCPCSILLRCGRGERRKLAARFNLQHSWSNTIGLVQTQSGLQVASPPRDTSMGPGRGESDGGLVIFAATGRERGAGRFGCGGESASSTGLEYTNTYFLCLSLFHGDTFDGDPKSIALPYS